MSKKPSGYQKKVLTVLLVSFGFGGLLAQFSPMKSGGFSSWFDDSYVKASAESSKTKEPAPVKIEKKVKPLSYGQQVNQEIEKKQYDGHLDLPLELQIDAKWKDTAYGFGNVDKPNTIEINGCAIVSLAMVGSYMDHQEVTPLDVLAWAKNDFFMEGQGTAWSIFSAYAEMKGYNCQEIGDIETVAAFLKEGHPVIISVKPGYFTTTGHIMVMSGVDEKGDFWINDPNDSEEKGHSKRTFTAEEVMNEALNFWAFY